MKSSALRAAAAAALAAGLAGCASLNTVSSDVSSYSQWPAERKPASYVYERLPSQQEKTQQQDELEAAARKALLAAGFSPAAEGAAADVSVQLSSRAVRYERYPAYSDPFWRWNFGYGWPGSRFGWGVGATFPIGGAPSVYEREIAVLIRDRKSGSVLYESRAVSNDYVGDAARLEAMFEAALKDFPQPAVNPRRINVTLPAKS